MILPLTTASSDYLDLAQVWRRQLNSVTDVKPTIICMDAKAYAAIQNDPSLTAELAAPELRNAANRRVFWIRRLAALRNAFERDGYLLHSDSDAFWLKDPSDLVERADLVISTERGLPKDIARRRGFVVCCGFFALRKKPETIAFFDAWQAECARRNDDQIAVNVLLDQAISEWSEVEIKGQTCYKANVDFGAGLFSVLALSNELVSRNHAFAVPEASVVAHAFFDKRFHREYVALYEHLVSRGSFGHVPRLARPKGMSDKEWTTLGCYRNLGDDIPPICFAHAGYLAMIAGEIEESLSYFDKATQISQDGLADLYLLYSRRGDNAAAKATLRRVRLPSQLSDGQLLRLARDGLKKPKLTSVRFVLAAAQRFSRPEKVFGGMRRFYLRSKGII